MRNHFSRLLRSLAVEQKGSMALFVGLGLFCLVAATGVAVDMSRLQTVRAKLAHALDAAGLAAGAKVYSSDAQTIVSNYMKVNFPAGFLNSNVISTAVTVNEDNTIIDLSSTARVNMTFLQIFGTDYIDVSADSQIKRENRGLELVMVLDVTGSMYSNGKINSLRTAATDMVDILFGEKDTIENLWVAVVPYVTTVNIGGDKINWLRNYDLTRYPPEYPAGATKWKGCVESRNQYPETNGLDLTDDVPDLARPDTLFPMYLWEDSSINNWFYTTTVGWGNNQHTQTVVDLDEAAGCGGGGTGPNIGCGNEVTPFTAEKDVVQSAINALTPWNRGGTMSSEGIAWGWRMISPKWRGKWNHADASLPLDYDTPLMNKAVIVMTDGINEVGSDYTSYGPIQDEHLGPNVDTSGEGVTAINNKFAAICRNMKEKGIIIYTLTFQLGSNSTANNARNLFRTCATKPDYYFDSPDGAALKRAFRQIGDSLANLTISR